MGDQDHEKIIFITPLGLFEFNHMLFGLSNAPITFKRLMEKCLGDFSFENVLVYLDNIIIFSKTFEDHVQHVDWVLYTKSKRGCQLEPKWEYIPYQVKGQPFPLSLVYHVISEGPNPIKRHCHCNLRPSILWIVNQSRKCLRNGTCLLSYWSLQLLKLQRQEAPAP